jgi:DNA-binding beta-propeller fold protein YncE
VSAGRSHPARVDVVLKGLNGAKPLNFAKDGNILFAQAGSGTTGLLQRLNTAGRSKGKITTLAKLPGNPSDVAAGPGRSVWVLFGAAGGPEAGPPPPGIPANLLYRWIPDRKGGHLFKVADLGAWAKGHPDPGDLENNPTESNAYGLAPLRDGSVLVADAAANSVLRVWPNGKIRTVVHLPVQMVSTKHLPASMNLPPMMPAEAVPTSVAVGPDGYWYVGELKGFPFAPGSSKVWRIKPGTTNTVCNAASSSSSCRVYLGGFTSIIDISFAKHGGDLYVLSFAKDGVGAVENADPNGPPPPGQLLRVNRHKHVRELAPGKIVLPGGVAISPYTGRVFVTDMQLVPHQGRMLRIR